MIQNVLQHLGGVQGYGIVSLCLFSGIFVMLVIWAAAQRKTHLDRMARLPLEDEDINKR
jgi:cbb3-type cytochrome oxidase subunit 3